MGAHDFMKVGQGKNANEVYRAMCEEAEYESGHSGYNGTISTTSGLLMVERQPLPEAIATRIANRLIEQDDQRIYKGGPCGCIPLADAKAITTRTVKLAMMVTPDMMDRFNGTPTEALREAVAKELAATKALRPGEHIVKIARSGGTPKVRGAVTTMPGKAVTRYVIVERYADPNQETISIRQIGDGAKEGYPTMAKARAALAAMVKTHADPRESAEKTYDVVGIILREGNTGLLRGTRRLVAQKSTITVTLATVDPKAVASRWLFFGWAAS